MITPHLRSTLGAVLVGSGAASMFVISFFPSGITGLIVGWFVDLV